MRLDKWLWAARFFKTRSLAKKAIDGGKIHIEGQRTKVSKLIQVGLYIDIKTGWDITQVKVTQLSSQRGNATLAQKLYQETQLSLDNKRKRKEQGQLQAHINYTVKKPNKKQRQQIIRFQRQQNNSDTVNTSTLHTKN